MLFNQFNRIQPILKVQSHLSIPNINFSMMQNPTVKLLIVLALGTNTMQENVTSKALNDLVVLVHNPKSKQHQHRKSCKLIFSVHNDEQN